MHTNAPASPERYAHQYGPKMIVTYAGPGKLKTIDAIHSWAGCGIFVALPGALELARTVCGVEIPSVTVNFLWDVERLLPELADSPYGALVIDEWHDLCQASWLKIQDEYKIVADERSDAVKRGKARVGQVVGYDRTAYSEYERYYTSLCHKLRAAPVHVHVNTRVQDPYVSDRTSRIEKGGPKCGWKKVVDTLPHLANVCQHALGAAATEPWNGRADCDQSHAELHQKTWIPGQPRRGGPLNTAELLRFAGHEVPWPAGLEHLEQWTAAVTEGIQKGIDRREVTSTICGDMVREGITHPHIAWAIKNGVHRAEFQRFGANALLAGF